MTFLICPDSFKESMSALDAATHIQLGIKKILPDANCLINPMSDGGDGALNLLEYYIKARKQFVTSRDPLNRKIKSAYLFFDDQAWISHAESSGLHLLKKSEQNPLYTSTYGTGLLINDAIEKGVRKIHLFLGGSATNDGGLGILQVFGWKFLNKTGIELAVNGQSLYNVHSVIPGKKFDDLEFQIYTDVRNPLLGDQGAVHTYAKQKGAKNSDLTLLESGMKNSLHLLYPENWESVNHIPGLGAAGGTALGLMQLSEVKFCHGFIYFAELSDLKGKIDQADIVITGEGQFNKSSLDGKVCGEILRLCQARNKIIIGLFGSIDKETEINYNRFIQMSIQRGVKSLDEALLDTGSDLQYISTQIAKLISYANR
jgi:glycerate kinase